MLAAALLLLAALCGAAWFFLRGRTAVKSAQALVLPAEEWPAYQVDLRYEPQTSVLEVTEEISFIHRGDAPLESVCLRFPAAAYTSQSTSPAAADDLFERAYPGGFSAADWKIDGCWIGGEKAEAVQGTDQPELFWVDANAAPQETVSLRLELRLKIPSCAGRFGKADDTVRLIQALPVLAARVGGQWDTAAMTPYADPQETDVSDFTVTADLPESLRLVTGAQTGANQLSLLLLPRDWANVSGRAGNVQMTVLAETRSRAEAILLAAKRCWPVLEALYGKLPLDSMTLVSLALPDTGCSAPGLTLLDSGLKENELGYRTAYWLAGQWFGWALGADRENDAWFCHASRQWAALRYVRDTAGGDSEADYRRLWVDLPMRENLHAAVTPGTPAGGFPDQATFLTVMDGRATAMYYALDTWMDGRFDDFLRELLRRHAFTRLDRAAFIRAAGDFCGLDIAPLMTDWLDTYMIEKPY